VNFNDEKNAIGANHHWPGMYRPSPDKENKSIVFVGSQYHASITISADEIEFFRYCQRSCATQEEADFIYSAHKARLQIIDRLLELNEGWRPGWNNEKQAKWEIFYYETENEISPVINYTNHSLPDWFQAKNEIIWMQIIEEFGPEKIRLGLGWTRF
jgi:hypothetical protein